MSTTSWWWRRAIGTATQTPDEQAAAAMPDDGHFRSVALIVGATGIVGSSLVNLLPLPDTPGGPWKVYALSRRPPPPWATSTSADHAAVTYLQVDLADSSAVAEVLAPLTDITHVFYAALSPPNMIDAWNRSANPDMLRNVLSVVVPNCPSLAHVCLQTGTKHYTGPPEAIASRVVGGFIRGIVSAIIGGGDDGSLAPVSQALSPPYTEDMPRLGWRNFYYDQEDVLFDAISRSHRGGGGGGGGISWSVHRPNLILGFSPRSAMNIVCSLCVYAAICQKEGVPLRWPGSKGSWEGFSTASDADLIAEQQIWAAVDADTTTTGGVSSTAKNQAFNCSNGDVFKWSQLWPILAGRFGLKWEGYNGEKKRFKLSLAMPRKAAVWAEIVEEKQLVETKLHEVVPNWWFVDGLFYANWEFIDSMNKSKEHGFVGFRNTAKSFNAWIDKMKAYKIVP